MTDNPELSTEANTVAHSSSLAESAGDNATQPRASISMHEQVPVWFDCCSCAAEPYWIAAMQEQADEETGSAE